MPSIEKVPKSSLTGAIDAFIDKKKASRTSAEGESEFLSIIEFIDRFKLLPDGLYPVQKFILKLYYSIPLSTVLPTLEKEQIRITDRFGDKIKHILTEVQYLQYLYDSGRCNLREQDGRQRRELVLVLGRRSGKCLEGDTLILTDSGILPLSELGDRTKTGWSKASHTVAQEGNRIRSRVNEFYNGGVQKTLSIQTYSGYRICGTIEHKIKVLDSLGNIVWKKFGDINIGDYLGIHGGTDLWAKSYLDVREYHQKSPLRELVLPNELDERWGRLLGILTGDGSWTYKNSIGVTGGCEEFLQILTNEFYDLFGDCSLIRKKHKPSTCPLFPWTLKAFSRPARKFLHDLGWSWDAKPITKCVPWSIMRSPKSVVSAYLSGLFETDGGLEKEGAVISFSTASERLAREVQILLLNFGITSNIRPKLNKKYDRYYWRLAVVGYDSRVEFAKEIGFITNRKNEALLNGIVNGSSGHSDNESVPFQRDRLRRLIHSIPISHNNVKGTTNRFRTWLKEACGNCSKPNSSENPSYSRLRKIISLGSKFGASKQIIDELKNIVNTNYFWDPVVSMKDGLNPVYDLSVPEGNSYVANGFTSHNSTISAIIAAYELYKLLCRRHPQIFYGMPSGSEIRVLCVANDKEQASIVYGDLNGYVGQVDYFKSAISSNTQTFLRFRTDNDRKKFGEDGKSTIVATFKSSIAKGLRGRGIICAILDELAFFVDDGKCLNVCSIILTESGSNSLDRILTDNDVDRSRIGWTDIKPIEIVQEGGRRSTATRVYYGGKQKTRIVKTKSKYIVEPTPEHRLKVMSSDGNIEWKYIRDIQIGDYTGINRETKLWPSTECSCHSLVPRHDECGRFECFIPSSVDVHLGEFLGILAGDGTWSSGKCLSKIMVTGGCEQFLPFVRAHFSRYFSVFGVYRSKPHKNNTCDISPWSVSKQSLSFRTFLDRVGYRLNATKSTKSVPWVIFKSPKPVVAAFLRGLFETDGGPEQKGRTISFTTASQQLAREVQLLLLNFGITASIYEKKNKNYPDRVYHYLRIIGHESRRIFAQEIRFITDRKNKDLDRGADFGRDASNIIPHQYTRLRRILESIPKSSNYTVKGDNHRTQITQLCSSSADKNRRSDISYDSARRLITLGRKLCADKQALDELEYICQVNYFWDYVTSIEESEGEVADLFVPDGNEYVAQGMTNHNSSAERVYTSITPSLKQFSPKNPKNRHKPLGPSEGRVIAISSPDARAGFFYRLYELSMTKGKESSNMIMVQAPTWEVNPTIDKSEYEIEYYKNPKTFATEYGAEFSDRVRGWIEDYRDLTDCIVPELRPLSRGTSREPFWAGVDFGIVNDGTSITLSHIHNSKIEVAYHEIWYAKKRWKDVNPHLESPLVEYAHKLQEVNRLDIHEIAKWFKALSLRFFILSGLFDQYAGPIFEQELHKLGLTQFEMRYFSTGDSSTAYQTAKMLMFSHQLALYDYPLPNNPSLDMDVKLHSPLVSELLELQATSGGKNITIVGAPEVAGKHDDMSDSFVRSLLLASEYIRAHPGTLEAGSFHISAPNPIRQVGYHQFQRMRARLHGPPDRNRTVPGNYRRR